MKQNQIKVLYVSHWEGGNIESSAILNINTGMITDIEDGQGGDPSEYRLNDAIQIASDIGVIQAIVELDANDNYRVNSITELETFRAAAKFEVLTEEFGRFINTSTQDGAPVYFQTLEAAREGLEERLLDVVHSVNNGDMDSEYDPSEFLIRDVCADETFTLDWNDKVRSDLDFVDSSVHYEMSEDPATCPSCGARSDFDEIKEGLQRHRCLSKQCNRVFFVEDSNAPQKSSATKQEDVSALACVISDKLSSLGFRNRGKAIKHTQVMEVAAAVMGYRNRHAVDTQPDAKVFSVMLLTIRWGQQTYTWSGQANDPNHAIETALREMNASWGTDIEELDTDLMVVFVAEGEVKYCCAPGDIDEDRFYLHP